MLIKYMTMSFVSNNYIRGRKTMRGKLDSKVNYLNK